MSRFRIAFTGDVMCPPGLTEICTSNGIICYDDLFSRIKPELSDCDLLVGNLETPIAGAKLEYTHERYCFNSPDEFAVMLKDYGFGLLCLANNHCMDRGEEGIDRTLDTLDRLGIRHTGLYRVGDAADYATHTGYTESAAAAEPDVSIELTSAVNPAATANHLPCVIEQQGIRVGFVNYTYGTNAFAHHRFLTDDLSGRVNLFQPQETLPGSIHLLESEETIARETARLYSDPKPDEYNRYIKPHLERLKADIDAARAESDFVVAVMHSGGQYNPLPDAYTRMLAQTLTEYGVDCIVGHHPHVIHPCEFIKRGDRQVFCAYSLGNLYCIPSICQDVEGSAHSVLLYLTLERDSSGVRLESIDYRVIYTSEREGSAPYCVKSLSSDSKSTPADKYAALFENNNDNIRRLY